MITFGWTPLPLLHNLWMAPYYVHENSALYKITKSCYQKRIRTKQKRLNMGHLSCTRYSIHTLQTVGKVEKIMLASLTGSSLQSYSKHFESYRSK